MCKLFAIFLPVAALIRKAQKHRLGTKLPIIVLTSRMREKPGKELRISAGLAHAANEERERGLVAGTDDYLTKPIQRVKLKMVLWNVQKKISI